MPFIKKDDRHYWWVQSNVVEALKTAVDSDTFVIPYGTLTGEGDQKEFGKFNAESRTKAEITELLKKAEPTD